MTKQYHLQLLYEKHKQLLFKIEVSESIECIDYKIALFYLEDLIVNISKELNMKVLLKEETDKDINIQIKKYNRIIALLETKKSLITASLDSITDELWLVNKKLGIFDLETEIASKRSFLSVFEKRKEILT